jgi:hypothetical protein
MIVKKVCPVRIPVRQVPPVKTPVKNLGTARTPVNLPHARVDARLVPVNHTVKVTASKWMKNLLCKNWRV